MFNSKHFLFQASYANIDRIKHIVIEDSRLNYTKLAGSYPKSFSLQSLQRGPVPPSEGSGCTHIPGRDGPSCPQVNEMHYAGKGLPSDAAFPSLTVRFRAAAIQS
ncbi:hypothetical protein OIU78_004318 [Salix suchowensis]|nr:hypothetical protein OIU78_004318 [Salix suchowensis]